MCCFVYISLILICYFLRKIKKTYCSLLLKKITCCAKRQKKVNCLSQPPPLVRISNGRSLTLETSTLETIYVT